MAKSKMKLPEKESSHSKSIRVLQKYLQNMVDVYEKMTTTGNNLAFNLEREIVYDEIINMNRDIELLKKSNPI